MAAVLIAGPTASGKSALAVEYAMRLGGAVVNADSMQVYRGIPILTAQPSIEETERVSHHLYGHVDPARDYSVGAWMRDARAVLSELARAGEVPIIVGGTGLYFRALLGGIDTMPPIPAEIRVRLRERAAREGPEVLHAELRRRDPDAAKSLRASDPQRVVRALELVETTGMPLAAIRRKRGTALVDPVRATKLVLMPERTVLRERIAERFEGMMRAGALDEADRFRALAVPAERTAAKAIGLAELAGYLDGCMTLELAVERAVTRSRQYAKRQETWFRHQFDESWKRVPA